MKTIYRIKAIALLLIIFCVTVVGTSTANAQKKSRMRIYFEKLSDDTKKISILITKGKGLDMRGIENAEIELTAMNGEEELPLTSIITNEEGEAYLLVESGYQFPKNEEGFIVVNGYFRGNDSIKASDKDIEFKDLFVDVSLDVIDSVKYITARVYEMDSVGVKTPVEEVDLNFGVERLHSILYLDKLETDADGIAEMEFPNDIPGDESGEIKIVVKVSDHKHYGTVNKLIDSDWGAPVIQQASNGRSLYGDHAPIWMTASIFLILGSAWFYFLYAIFKVYKLKKSGDKIIKG